MMEAIVRTSGLATLREQTTLFALSVSEAEAMHLQPVTDALHKASLPSVGKTDMPMVSSQQLQHRPWLYLQLWTEGRPESGQLHELGWLCCLVLSPHCWLCRCTGFAAADLLSGTAVFQVLVIGAKGKALKVLRGLVTAGEVRQCLTDGVAAFQSQAWPKKMKTAPSACCGM